MDVTEAEEKIVSSQEGVESLEVAFEEVAFSQGVALFLVAAFHTSSRETSTKKKEYRREW